jgi:hypothetical protein
MIVKKRKLKIQIAAVAEGKGWVRKGIIHTLQNYRDKKMKKNCTFSLIY